MDMQNIVRSTTNYSFKLQTVINDKPPNVKSSNGANLSRKHQLALIS